MDAVQTCGKLWGTQYLEEGASALQSFKLGQSMDVEEIPRKKILNINPNHIGGGGQVEPCDVKYNEKCPYSHHNNIALIKQINLSALSMTNT